MDSEPLLSGIILAVVNFAPLREFGTYGLVVFAVYLIGIVAMVPLAGVWYLEEKDNSGGLKQTITKTLTAISQNFISIFFICLVWPFVFLYLCFSRQVSYLALLIFAVALASGLLAVDVISKPSTEVLLSTLEQSSRYRSRNAAAKILRQRGDPEAIQPLINLAQNASSKEVRSSAVSALRGKTDKRILSFLLQEYTKSPQNLPRESRIALNDYDAAIVLAELIPLLQNGDVDGGPKSIIAWKMRQLIKGGNNNPENIDRLIFEKIQSYSSLLLSKSNKKKPYSSLIKSGKNVPDPLAGYTYLAVLVKTPLTTKALITLIGNRRVPSRIQTKVAFALGYRGSGKDIVNALINALEKNKSGHVRQLVVEALGSLGDKTAIPILITTLTDPRTGRVSLGGIQRSATYALKKLGWKPGNTAETVHLAVAITNFRKLLNMWEDTKLILLEDVESGDNNRLANAVLTFIRLGRDEVLKDLVEILNKRGNLFMATVYLRSGNDVLKTASISWAKANGYQVLRVPGLDKLPKWGK